MNNANRAGGKRCVSRPAFSRLVSPGRTSYGRLFLEIAFDGSKLSITGVEGPKKNGDCTGSCGQCIDALGNIIERDELHGAWTAERIAWLRETWDRWHLNDMRAGCEHQRAAKWSERPIDQTKPLNAYGKHFEGQRQDSWNMLAWVTRREHPQGLLSQPCATCGYKYGSAWLHEDVPDDVLDALEALQNTTEPYPWHRLKTKT